MLSTEDWNVLLAGARFRRYRRGMTVIEAGVDPNGLYQIMTGTLRVELQEKGRPQSLVVGRCQQGEMFGETTLLLGRPPTLKIVCDTEEAMVTRLPRSYLEKTFSERPGLAARFFCLLAMRTSARLEKMKQQDPAELKVRIDDDANAPRTMEKIVENPAFFFIFHKFVLSVDAHREEMGAVLDFIQEVRNIYGEPDIEIAHSLATSLWRTHMSPEARRPLECLSEHAKMGLQQQLKRDFRSAPKELRHIFDVPLQVCMRAIEDACFDDFKTSPHYQYILCACRYEPGPHGPTRVRRFAVWPCHPHLHIAATHRSCCPLPSMTPHPSLCRSAQVQGAHHTDD